jgi:hypothetical protein
MPFRFAVLFIGLAGLAVLTGFLVLSITSELFRLVTAEKERRIDPIQKAEIDSQKCHIDCLKLSKTKEIL